MYKLIFFVPETHLEPVKTAVFAAGAGSLGNYEQCCWQVLGQGQFKPLAGAQPYVGQSGQLECLPEYRVEVLCAETVVRAAVSALRAAHPYEEPAYELVRLVDPEALP